MGIEEKLNRRSSYYLKRYPASRIVEPIVTAEPIISSELKPHKNRWYQKVINFIKKLFKKE